MTPTAGMRVRRTAAWLGSVAASNAEGAVYGAMMIGVLLAAEDARHETYAETIAAAAIVLVLYWLMHLYTYVLGVRLRTKQALGREVIWRSVVHEVPVIEGAITPLIVLVVAWTTGASVASGVNIALFATAISIVILELAAALLARSRGPRLWLTTGVGALAGLGVVAVKVVLHV